MECDGMHSGIEGQGWESVYSMSGWIQIFRDARKGRNNKKGPYKVKELKYQAFLNLQKLSEETIRNRTTSRTGETVHG
jgi:hypothetical protein